MLTVKNNTRHGKYLSQLKFSDFHNEFLLSIMQEPTHGWVLDRFYKYTHKGSNNYSQVLPIPQPINFKIICQQQVQACIEKKRMNKVIEIKISNVL